MSTTILTTANQPPPPLSPRSALEQLFKPPPVRRGSSSGDSRNSKSKQHTVPRRPLHALRFMARHVGLPQTSHRSVEQQQEIREARRLLKQRVREDWEYPALPAYRESNSGRKVADISSYTVGGFKVHDSTGAQDLDKIVQDLDNSPVEWREREYSTVSDSEAGTAEHDSFKFESPDTVGVDIQSRHKEYKRRRHQTLLEEIRWNDGLAHWIKRRNVWSGALNSQDVSLDDTHDQAAIPSLSSTRTLAETAISKSPRTSTSSSPSLSTDQTSDRGALATASSAATTPEPSVADLGTTSASLSSKHSYLSEVLIPVAPRILPDHPVRRSISPSMHSEIYTKIIVQGRTPSVPINLQNVISSLVQGWKDDGEWPPRSGVLEPSIGKKKKGAYGSENALKSGVKAVGRVLRLTGAGESHTVRG